MNIYLPIADMTIGIDLLLIIGFVAGILSGLYGISGGMITGPALIFAGLPSYIAVGASSSQTVGTAFTGTIRNWNKGNIDIKMAICIFIGGFFSSVAGVKLSTYLRSAGYIDIVIACTYVAVFGITSLTIYIEILVIEPIKKWFASEDDDFFDYKIETSTFNRNGIFYIYSSITDQYFNIFFLLFVGILTGFLSAILGIGGATILVPILMYFLKMPFSIASNTALFQTLLTSINITFLQASYNYSVDLVLFSTMLISSIFGVHIGGRIASKFNQKILKLTFAMLMNLMCIQFIFITFIKNPISLFIVE